MDDDTDITEFVEHERHRLVGALIAYGCDRAAADDIGQESFARLWERWRTIDEPAAWLYRVAFNLARSRWRRLRQERGGRSTGPEPAADLPDIELRDQVRSALDQLPARQRQTIILRYFLDLSVADTADVMRCTPGTVKAATSQALRHLSNQLSDLEVLDA